MILGVVFVSHGVHDWQVLGLSGIAWIIRREGFPPDAVWLLTVYLLAARIVGGLLILIGAWTEIAALAQVPIMASSVFFLHWREGFFMHASLLDAAKGRVTLAGYEYPLVLLVATLALAVLGPGAWSLRERRLPRFEMP
jgi:putative oxidoreductase